jgi:hypothetical protein
MVPIVNEEIMQDRTHMVKTSNHPQAGFVEHIIRIFPLPPHAWEDLVMIKLMKETYFPIYYHQSPNHHPAD